MLHRLLAIASVLLSATAGPRAQQPAPADRQPAGQQPAAQLTAASFLPDTPQGEVMVDLRAMRERDIWEELEHTLLAPFLQRLGQQLGFPLADLDRMQMWIARDAESDRPGMTRVVVMEGKVALPPSVDNEMWTDEKIGGHDAKVFTHAPMVTARVGNLLVQGARGLIEPVLLGKSKGGRPGADQLSLLSGRDPALLHVFVDLIAARRGAGEFGFLEKVEYPEDDPATHLVLRIRMHGEADDPRLLLEGIVRHKKGAQGLEKTEAAAKQWLKEMEQHPRFAALKKLWSAVVITRNGPDLTGQLDLGRPRAAAGTLALLMAPVFNTRETAQRAAAGEAEATRDAEEQARRKAEEERKQRAGGGR